MRIGIVDADLIGRQKHRFPNLVSMKLSAFHKSIGDQVELCLSYDGLDTYDHVYVSKVFTDTVVPDSVLQRENVTYGGTGFYYDKAPALPDEIEHIRPDYSLYDEWVAEKLKTCSKTEMRYYTDYSIGFLTRGCFRQCSFCVNQKYTRCSVHSPVEEFMDPSRPKLCFLDDNFFACPKWKDVIEEVKATGKRFEFKQGLDERLLTTEKIDEIVTWKYDGDLIFAFDNIEDRYIIESKLKLFRDNYPKYKRKLKFYVLCGYDRNGKYDDEFFRNDIRDTFERIKILMKYRAVPYIMRYEEAYRCKYSKMYIMIASWCNQPSIFLKLSFRQFCMYKGMGVKYNVYKDRVQDFLNDRNKKLSCWVAMEEFGRENPQVEEAYYDMKFENERQY